MSQFRDKAAEFEQAGAKIVAISVDNFFATQAFSEQLNLNFPILSDFNREVIPNYAGFYEKALGMLQDAPRRSVFIVDKSGLVRYRWLGPEDSPGVLPDVGEVLEAAKAVRA